MNLNEITESRPHARAVSRTARLFTLRGLSGYWEYFRSLPKTLFFNFKYFPFNVAVKVPVFVSHRVLLKQLAGKVELGRVKTGMVKIGFGDIPLFDSRKTKSVLLLTGKIVFQGTADIGPGCQLGIAGELICGDGFAVTANSMIATRARITFGKNAMISWDVSVMDHDWHDICDQSGNVLNPPRPILIGDDVWICCKAMVLKGCTIPNGIIVAAGATVTGSVKAVNAIIGDDVKLRVLKENVFWKK